MTEILILDYNRPQELLALLLSIKKNARFDKKVVVLNNGGDKYADQFLESGMCDRVIHNAINIGCGAGTVQLFSQCQSDFAFYIQVDHSLETLITENMIETFKNDIIIEGNFYVDLAGDQGHGEYSERAQFIRRSDYLIAQKDFGGPGPLADQRWTEQSVQEYMDKEMSFFKSYYMFRDCGWDSVRENPDGSLWKHHPDTKVLFCLQAPKQKFVYPNLTDEEWKEAIAGDWPTSGKIPEKEKDSSFQHWNEI